MLSLLSALFTPPDIHGFEAHLLEAIASNEARMAAHGADGRDARAVYRSLVLVEKALLPTARAIDALAAPHVASGVPVVEADFVSMDGLPPYDQPTSAEEMTTADQDAARAIVSSLVWSAAIADLDVVVDASADALSALEALEASAGVHFPMTRHVIESAGYAALHGMQHNCDSGGETRWVVQALVRAQLLGLAALDATWFDAAANPFHVDGVGVGVLINDVPPIPFAAERAEISDTAWAALSRCQ